MIMGCPGGHPAFVVVDYEPWPQVRGRAVVRLAKHFFHEMGERCPYSGLQLKVLAAREQEPA